MWVVANLPKYLVGSQEQIWLQMLKWNVNKIQIRKIDYQKINVWRNSFVQSLLLNNLYVFLYIIL